MLFQIFVEIAQQVKKLIAEVVVSILRIVSVILLINIFLVLRR